ncbi:MAG: glycerophosphodiester phosphodiesterase family protein [Polyangia bacterium]
MNAHNLAIVVLLGSTACTQSPGKSGDGGSSADAALTDASVPDAQAAPADAQAAPGDAQAPGDGGATYRNSLGTCWTDASCKRVLAVAHGGAWDSKTKPYDSNAALAAAFADGNDGVKIDVRVSADGIPVIAHSSPILYYESLDCINKKIETMTAAEVTACHRFPSTTETFQRLDDVLGYLRGKMVVQLCVKVPDDYARTIAEIHAQAAEDFAFIEVDTPQRFETLIPTLPGADTVYYVINVASTLSDIDGLLATNNPRGFMYEIDPGVAIGTLVADRLHPAGVRAFIYDNAPAPTVAQLHAHYDEGYDVVSSQSGPIGVQARVEENTARGVTPP